MKNNNGIIFAYGDDSITILHKGKPNVITSDRVNYRAILDAVKADDAKLVYELLDEVQAIKTMTEGRVTITGNKVFFDGEEIHGAIVSKLTHMLESGFTNLTGWMKFTEKLMKNPSMKSREQSYPFIARTDILITPEGNCRGYKGVNNEFYSIHGNTSSKITKGTVNSSGQIFNGIGETIEMDRAQVDDDSNHGCSSGLHIGSHKYADNWGSNGKLLIVEFNPKNIVSVPTDSNYEKLRVCKYKVIEECTDRQVLQYTSESYNDNDHDLFEFIYDQCNADNTVSLTHIQEQFPDTSITDVISLGESRPEYRIGHQFNDDYMDWDISVEYTD